MKTGFLITARLKSTRLPMKLLKKVHGETIITWMIRRLKLATVLDEIIIATSTNSQDDPLEKIAAKEGIKCFRGSEEDVCLRLFEASKAYNLDYFISMTADCPLLPFDLIEDLINTFNKTKADLVSCYELSSGLFLSGVKPTAMQRLINEKDSENTEYWLYYFLKTDMFKVVPLDIDKTLIRPNYRFSLDYPEDMTFLRSVFEGLGQNTYKATTKEIIEFVDANPTLAEVNKDCSKKAKERTNADSASKVRLKGIGNLEDRESII